MKQKTGKKKRRRLDFNILYNNDRVCFMPNRDRGVRYNDVWFLMTKGIRYWSDYI